MSKITTKLQQAEEVIEQGIEGYKAAGEALREIRDDGLYKQEFKTFEEYLKGRWNWDRSYAFRLIDAAKVAEVCRPMGDISNERQARELTKLPSADLQRAAFGVAETIAEQHKAGKITAKTVAKAVDIVQKVVAENPNIEAKDIAAKAVECGAVDDIEPHNNEEPQTDEKDLLIDALNTEIDSVYDENERLKNRLAANVMEKDDIEPQFERLNELLEENIKLKAMNCALTKSRDNVMSENAALKKQCQIYLKRLKAFEK